MTTKKKGKCVDCGKPTDMRGWYFVHPKNKPFSLKNSRKSYRYWCEQHFLIHMFNLWPFQCTDECREKHSNKLGINLKEKDTIVWIDLMSAMTVNNAIKPVKIGDGESFAMKPLRPKCPRCGKGMSLVAELFNKEENDSRKNKSRKGNSKQRASGNRKRTTKIRKANKKFKTKRN